MSLVLKAQERKYSIFLIFALCLLFLGQASAWTSSEFIGGII